MHANVATPHAARLADLVVEAGSSSMKFAVFAFPPHDEHAAALRERICASPGWLGIDLDLFTCSESAADIWLAIGCRYARRRAKRPARRTASPKPRAV